MNKLIRSEWIKFSTLRTNWIILAVTVVLAAIFHAVVLSLDGEDFYSTIEERVEGIVGPVFIIGALLGILGVLIINSEFRSRTVIPSFAAAPIRAEVIVAKGIVLSVVTLITAVLLVAAGVISGKITLDERGYPVSFDADNFWQTAAGAVLFIFLYAMFGYGLGLVLTNSAAAITVLVLFPILVESSLAQLPWDWIEKSLPFSSGLALASPGGNNLHGPWEGGAIFGLYAAVLLVAGAVYFERRDLGNTG